jgi:hypothetical protein
MDMASSQQSAVSSQQSAVSSQQSGNEFLIADGWAPGTGTLIALLKTITAGFSFLC